MKWKSRRVTLNLGENLLNLCLKSKNSRAVVNLARIHRGDGSALPDAQNLSLFLQSFHDNSHALLEQINRMVDMIYFII